ncbi:hypothetical protein GXM_08036 [Nostoc sphaeroides CCNUC1]|uniref:Uncharacterized protein n=1 Tax=Nostoc sphaeroides CCNUC1 TaxID=2653204 RepID=A0A5P8WDB2_9NOSO|nr:hypothetical protein GXM_08036 [Nostoc sphaeroides CCNUC1]
MPRSQSPTGNAVLEAKPQDLRQQPNRIAFPARGWKRDLKRVLA